MSIEIISNLIDWFETEAMMRQFLQNNRGYIRWKVALSYDNLSVGCPSSMGTTIWAQQMVVDWVRVYQQKKLILS